MNRPVILGGGQLALMLLEAWQQLCLKEPLCAAAPPLVLNAGAGCAQTIAKTILREELAQELNSSEPLFVDFDIQDGLALANFLKEIAAKKVAFEIETVDLSYCKNLSTKFFPSIDIVEMIQSKTKQKQWFIDNKIPTAAFNIYANLVELKKQADLKFPLIAKASSGGYDGRGVRLVANGEDLQSLDFPGEIVLEELLDIETELAVIVVADVSATKIFPATEMLFSEQKQLHYLSSPGFSVSKTISAKAEKMALEIAKQINLEGILAIEFIYTKQGDLYVNEMAPRPHNSGHHSIEAYNVSQFSQYLRVLYDLPLLDLQPKAAAAVMANIVGIDASQQVPQFVLKTEREVFIHNYQKENKLNRKIGHMTILGEDAAELLAEIKTLESQLEIRI